MAKAIKATREKKRLRAAILGTARDLNKAGIVSKASLARITMKTAGALLPPAPPQLSASQIREIRERAGVSQAVFARYIGVTAGVVSKWERGDDAPSPVARRLLSVVKKRGLDVMR